ENISGTLIPVDIYGDDIDDPLTRRVTADAAIFVYDLTSGMPNQLLTFDYPDRFDPLQHWLIPPLNRAYPQIAVARNDGYLTVFDDQLNPIDIGADGGIPGIRIGGYYASGAWRDLARAPRVASLDGGPNQSILVLDSRQSLLNLDASQATLNVRPERVWQRSNVLTANVSATLNAGNPGIACTALQEPVTTPPGYRVQVLDPATGAALWSQNTDAAPLNDIVFGNLNGDTTPDLAMQWGNPSDTLLQTRAFDGTNGTVLWDSPAFEPTAGRQPAGLSVLDVNDDLVDDILTAGAGVRALDGNDGTVLASV